MYPTLTRSLWSPGVLTTVLYSASAQYVKLYNNAKVAPKHYYIAFLTDHIRWFTVHNRLDNPTVLAVQSGRTSRCNHSLYDEAYWPGVKLTLTFNNGDVAPDR
jgi:hypothetical protein